MAAVRICLSILLVLGIAHICLADENTSINISRDADGQLTEDSLKNVELLEGMARRQGYVVLWLTATVPFNPNEEELLPSQIVSRDNQVRYELDEVLTPLIADGLVWSDPKRPDVEGPGVSVWASSKGLASLVSDTRIRNIIYSEE